MNDNRTRASHARDVAIRRSHEAALPQNAIPADAEINCVIAPQVEELAREWALKSELAGRTPRLLLLMLCDLLYDYQLEYIFDDGRFSCWVASRQIGKSFALTWKALLRALLEPRRHQIFLSASRSQADELIEKVNAHLDFLEEVLGVEFRAGKGDGKQNQSFVTLANGSVIMSRAASKRSTRGWSGDVHWDETAITPFDVEMGRSIFAVASRHDYRVSLTSTPLGDTGLFHDCARGPRSSGFTQHTTTIHQAIAQGCPTDLTALRILHDDDSWAQEYECQFLSDAMSYFPREVLLQLEAKGGELVERARKVEAKACSWYGGMDIGRKRDLSAMSWIQKFPGVRALLAHPVEVLKKAPFPEQARWFESGVRKHDPERVYIDHGGLGMERAEELADKFPAIVEPIDFTAPVKKRLAENMRLAIERGLIGMDPSDQDTIRELHSIRRKITTHGNISYTADRTDDGHADRATALMLACLAATNESAGFFMVPGGDDEIAEEIRAADEKKRNVSDPASVVGMQFREWYQSFADAHGGLPEEPTEGEGRSVWDEI